MNLKINNLRLKPHLPGANDLTLWPLGGLTTVSD